MEKRFFYFYFYLFLFQNLAFLKLVQENGGGGVGKAPVSATVAATTTALTVSGAPVVMNMPAKTTHGRSFRSGREKKFQCTVCERKFLAQAHLNDHMLIHTGVCRFV